MNKEPIHGPFVVAFNGPPRAGKDTAANLLADMLDKSVWVNAPVIQLPFAMPMRKAAMAVFGLDYSFKAYETFKDTPVEMLDGMTLRQYMIALSEDFMKVKFGKEIWCNIWRRSIPGGFAGVVIVPDLGFQLEANYMIRELGSERVVAVQVAREGKTFVGDSRENVGADQNFAIENNGTLDDLATEVGQLIGRLTNKYRWQI